MDGKTTVNISMAGLYNLLLGEKGWLHLPKTQRKMAWEHSDHFLSFPQLLVSGFGPSGPSCIPVFNSWTPTLFILIISFPSCLNYSELARYSLQRKNTNQSAKPKWSPLSEAASNTDLELKRTGREGCSQVGGLSVGATMGDTEGSEAVKESMKKGGGEPIHRVLPCRAPAFNTFKKKRCFGFF